MMSDSHPKEIAVVVGATGAFGQCFVANLLDHGLKVVAVARNVDQLNQHFGGYSNVIPCVADISSDKSIEAIKEVLDAPVRAVVHGPGVGVAGGILTAPTHILVDAVNIKVGGLLRLCRAADEHFVEQSRIIAIGGHYGLEPTAYAASAGIANSALVSASRQLSLAYGSRGITSHVIAPGPADTERMHRVAETRAESLGTTVEAVLDEVRAESSIGAFTTPEQVAWAVEMLLAPEASAMTGSTLMLDSGRRRGLP